MSMAKTTTSKRRGPSSETVASHLRLIRVLSVCVWSLSALLIHLASYLPLFDSSPHAVLNGSDSSLLRWDAFHFGHIAREGYVYEYEWAFLPGLPFLVMRPGAYLLHWLGLSQSSDVLSWTNVLRSGAFMASIFGMASTTTLYELTLELTGSAPVALLSSLLSLLPSSPATFRYAPYTEPFFTYLSYKGMLCCAKLRYLRATFFFMLAGTFRSNGFMLSGFILWGLLLEPVLSRRPIHWTRLPTAFLLTALIFLPFLSHQAAAYLTLCRDSPEAPAWCSSTPPLIYSYVQSKYWNVGFLRYWTLSQLPNFLISIPVLILLLWFSVYHIRHVFFPHILAALSFSPPPPPPSSTNFPSPKSPFLTSKITPHAVHASIFTSILLFASHTQIILRLAASMPFTYWAAAYLLMEHPKWGRWWVVWSVLWGAVSLTLWTSFLPPA